MTPRFLLDDQETYKNLKTHPTASTMNDVNKFVNNLLETKKITKETSFVLKTSDATTLRLSELPDLHKKHPLTTNSFFHRLTCLRLS